MTFMQGAGCKSHSVVNDTYAFDQWQKCRDAHNPVFLGNRSMTNMHLVNDKYAGTESKSHSVVNDIYASGQWQKCRQLSLNIILWSMTFMRAHLSLTGVNDKYACIFVIDHGQWQIWRLLSLNWTHCSCIFVIDYDQWQKCRYRSR